MGHTFQELQQLTYMFFELHWPNNKCKRPEWSKEWFFKGTIPNYDKKGCYALFNQTELIYVGLAIGDSKGIDKGSGLGQRLNNYWYFDKTKENEGNEKIYQPKLNISNIRTIPFDNYCYLAGSLEIYLIQNLPQLDNKVRLK